jgi:hypothetical protein
MRTFFGRWGFLVAVMLSPVVLFGGCAVAVYVRCGGMDVDEIGAVYPVPAGFSIVNERRFTDGSYESNAHVELTLSGGTAQQVADAYRARGYELAERSSKYQLVAWPGRGDGDFEIAPREGSPDVDVHASRKLPCAT